MNPPARIRRRLVENELIMESLNRRLEERVEEARAEDDEDLEAPIAFFCECSDIGCRERLSVRPDRYEAIHREADLFIVLPDHEVAAVETTVELHAEYAVVRKAAIP